MLEETFTKPNIKPNIKPSINPCINSKSKIATVGALKPTRIVALIILGVSSLAQANQPPVEISRTFIEFRKAEEEGDWTALLNLYSEDSKIVLLGPQNKGNFGFEQETVELSKGDLKELVNNQILRHQNHNLLNPELRNNKTQNTQNESTLTPSPIIYESLSFSLGTKSASEDDSIIYEARGLRKLQAPASPQQSTTPNDTLNIDAPSGQFYMEIEKDQYANETKIKHHAYEPYVNVEISKENLPKLENKNLRTQIESTFFPKINHQPESNPTSDAYDQAQSSLSGKLNILRIQNAKTTEAVFKYFLELMVNPTKSTKIGIIPASKTSIMTTEVLEKHNVDPDPTSDLTTHLTTHPVIEEGYMFTLIRDRTNKGLTFTLISLRVVITQNEGSDRSVAFVVKAQSPLTSKDGLTIEEYQLGASIESSRETLKAVSLEESKQSLSGFVP
jgi:hypothetical protein